MTTIELYIKKRLHRFVGPSSWKELTGRQAIAIMRLRSLDASDPMFLFPILKVLFGMKVRQMRWIFDERFLIHQGVSEDDRANTLWQGALLLQEIRWIHEIDPDATFAVRNFRVNDFFLQTPWRWLKSLSERTVYLGPGEALGNCTFKEFIWADKAYRDEDWPRLASVLYRPQHLNPHGHPVHGGPDQRDPFDLRSVEARAKRFARLHPALLDLVRFNYECSLYYLRRTFKRVFTSKADGEKSAGKSLKSPWLDITLVLAKLDVTKVHQIEETNLYLVLKTLDKNIEQVEALESK